MSQPAQEQEVPGIQSEMRPVPDCGEVVGLSLLPLTRGATGVQVLAARHAQVLDASGGELRPLDIFVGLVRLEDRARPAARPAEDGDGAAGSTEDGRDPTNTERDPVSNAR